MTYFDFTAGNKDYKLRLRMQDIMALEKRIGMNPLALFGVNGDRVPTFTEMVCVLHASLQDMHHGIDVQEAGKILEVYMNEGHTINEIYRVILGVYRASGLASKKEVEVEDDEKNA